MGLVHLGYMGGCIGIVDGCLTMSLMALRPTYVLDSIHATREM